PLETEAPIQSDNQFRPCQTTIRAAPKRRATSCQSRSTGCSAAGKRRSKLTGFVTEATTSDSPLEETPRALKSETPHSGAAWDSAAATVLAEACRVFAWDCGESPC